MKSKGSSIEKYLDSIAIDSKTLIEGGHFTVEVAPLDRDSESSQKNPSNILEMLLIIQSTDPIPELRQTILDIKPTSDNPKYRVVAKMTNEEVARLAEKIGYKNIFKVSCPVSDTQFITLRDALKACAYLSANGHKVSLGILIGDIQLPTWSRANLKWLLPENYREEIDRFGQSESVELISEAACRNQGKRRILDKQKKKFLDSKSCEEIYKKDGYSVFRNQKNKALYLTSDYIMESYGSFPYVIGLTKDEFTTTCALILAGKLYSLFKKGYNNIVCMYDECDDNQIYRKCLDGALIASYLVPDITISVLLWITKTYGSNKKISRDREIDLSKLCKPGKLKSVDDLLNETRKANKFPGFDHIDPFCSEMCIT